MPGRFASESVADFKRNQWPIWRGIGGRFGAESPSDRPNRSWGTLTGEFSGLLQLLGEEEFFDYLSLLSPLPWEKR
jgi:hypothetical protein